LTAALPRFGNQHNHFAPVIGTGAQQADGAPDRVRGTGGIAARLDFLQRADQLVVVGAEFLNDVDVTVEGDESRLAAALAEHEFRIKNATLSDSRKQALDSAAGLDA